MNTSYYAKYKGDNGISIAGRKPDWWIGKENKILAPKVWFFNEYKELMRMFNLKYPIQPKKPFPEIVCGDIYLPIYLEELRKIEQFYIENYYKEVLNKLNAKQIYNELGEDAVLLCWEASGKFCHRHLVSHWFEAELGIQVLEL